MNGNVFYMIIVASVVPSISRLGKSDFPVGKSTGGPLKLDSEGQNLFIFV